MATLERILMVGGGIAGLTLATALHRQGFTAELVERSPILAQHLGYVFGHSLVAENQSPE